MNNNKRLNILHLEDEPDFAELVCSLLEQGGVNAEVKRVGDRLAFTQALDVGKFDLIISDYRLGEGKTGFRAIERVRRAFGTDVPAFLISGDTAPERLREASASGYFLLPKPVLPINLRATVSRLLMSPADVARTDETAERVEAANARQLAAGPNPGLPPQ